MATRITDPRLLMQLIEPSIPVLFGPQLLAGTIIDFEDPQAALVQIEQYVLGPPISCVLINRAFAWIEVHNAYRGFSGPLIWY